MNLLVTGAWNKAKENIENLKSMGHEVVYMQQEKDVLPCNYEWVEGVICNGLFLSHPIEKFVKLQFIQLTSAGFDRVPMDYVKALDIEIHNAKGVYSIPMAEFAITGVLQLYKQRGFFYVNQKQKKWEKHRDQLELNGKTVCIIGCGDVGTECGKIFRAFGCKVMGVNRTFKTIEQFDKIASLSDLDSILPNVDIVVLTLALTDETYHLMNAVRLAKVKSTVIIVNIARGAIVDTNALVEALPNLGGAVLDVFEEEPLAESSPLWNMENVIVTPHNSFVGDGNETRLSAVIMKNIENR